MYIIIWKAYFNMQLHILMWSELNSIKLMLITTSYVYNEVQRPYESVGTVCTVMYKGLKYVFPIIYL